MDKDDGMTTLLTKTHGELRAWPSLGVAEASHGGNS